MDLVNVCTVGHSDSCRRFSGGFVSAQSVFRNLVGGRFLADSPNSGKAASSEDRSGKLKSYGDLMLEDVTIATFSDHVEEEFTATIDGQPVSAVLVETKRLPVSSNADEWGAQPEKRGREPFALVFRMPVNVPQGMYPISHATVGEIGALFLVPIARDEYGWYYEAIFN